MKRKLVKIGEASRLLGTSPAQLRKWDVSGDLRPTRRTRGGTRYYAVADLAMAPEFVADDAVTVCCAWASGPDQEAELERQQSVMSAHCSAMGCRVLTLCNASGDGVGPGMRDLLEMIVRRRVQRLVVADGQHFRASVPGS